MHIVESHVVESHIVESHIALVFCSDCQPALNWSGQGWR